MQEDKTYDEKGNLTRISKVVVPRLLVYQPDSVCGTGIIVCPGSGYKKLNVENTRFIANRLNKMGILVFVLVHRLPADITTENKTIAALQDLHAAIQLVRSGANEWGLSHDRIGIWGSSAGGHLAATAATHYTTQNINNFNPEDLRPDFLILAWPLISFRPGLVHQGSMTNLLGETPSEKQIKYFSADEWVTNSTPPAFLVHASDDGTVPPGNSIKFFEALRKNNVPAELHIYEKGGHSAFGIAPDVEDSWISQLEIWLRNNNYIK